MEMCFFWKTCIFHMNIALINHFQQIIHKLLPLRYKWGLKWLLCLNFVLEESQSLPHFRMRKWLTQMACGCSFLDWFSRRAGKCFLNDLYNCLCKNRRCCPTMLIFSSATLPVRWNFSYNALIAVGCRHLATWKLGWKFLLFAVRHCPSKWNSNTRKILSFMNALFSTLSEYADQLSTVRPKTLHLSVNINPLCGCILWFIP